MLDGARMRTSWAMAVSLALAGCGAEFAAVEEQIVDGGDEAGESEGGVFQGASSTSATRVTIGGTIVSTPPRKERVVVPTQPATKVAAAQISDVLVTPAGEAKGGIEVASAWMAEARVDQLIAHGDLVTYADGYRATVVDRRDGSIVRTHNFDGCSFPIARVRGSLFATCGADNAVTAVDPETLEVRWQRKLERIVAALDGGEGTLLVSLRSEPRMQWQEVVALGDAGDVKWRSWLPASNVSLRADGDELFAFERDPTVWALDPADGHVRWSRKTEKAIFAVVPLRDALTAVIGQEGLWLLDDGRDAASRGTLKEARAVSEIDWPRMYSCDDGQLSAIDLESGRELWHTTVAPGDCRVFSTGRGVFVQNAEHLLALDTTQPAGRASAVTIRGRFRDKVNERKKVRGIEVHVANRVVRTDAHGRFAATVRVHGPIAVRLDGVQGPESDVVLWPDGKSQHRVDLSNMYYEDCD